MEETLYSEGVEPGILQLKLNVNKCCNNEGNVQIKDPKSHPFHRDIAFRYECLRNDLIDDDVPDPESTLVLLSTLALRLGKTRAAIQHCEEVLESNPSNLNAVLNLSSIWKHIKVDDSEVQYKRKLAELLGETEVEVPEEVLNTRLAHCLADQAYAYAYDVGIVSYEDKRSRLITAIEMYDKAMSLGLRHVRHEVQWKWQFMLATIFLSLDTIMFHKCVPDAQRLPGFNRAINLLKEVAKSNNHFQKAISWAYLGIFLERQFTFENTPISIHDCGFTSTQALDCFSKAIELADQNPTVLNRLAKVFQSMNKHELAVGAADMSLKLEPNIRINSSALHTRAKVNIAIYMRNLQRCKNGVAGMPNRSNLEKAKSNLEELLKVSAGLSTYIELGQVCYYMGVDALKETFIVDEESVNSALVYFSKALDCETGGTLPELQLLRGKCLRIKGEERNALECFKRAIELDNKGSQQTKAFSCLMETLLTWHAKQSHPKVRAEIVQEFETWLRLAQAKHSNSAIQSELKFLMQNYTQEILDFCKETIKSGNMTLSSLCLSCFGTTDDDKRILQST